MDIRKPMPKSAASLLRASLAEMGVSIKHSQSLELIARVNGYNNWYSMQQDPAALSEPVLKSLGANSFAMSDSPGTGCIIEVGAVKARLFADGSGVSMALFGKEQLPSLLPVEGEPALASGRVAHSTAVAQGLKKPDPSQPFYNCELPYDVNRIVFVSSDARALDWTNTCPVLTYNNSVVDWWNAGAESDDADLSEELVEYQDQDTRSHSSSISMQALYEARLSADGRFELATGEELYLITPSNQRWAPSRPR